MARGLTDPCGRWAEAPNGCGEAAPAGPPQAAEPSDVEVAFAADFLGPGFDESDFEDSDEVDEEESADEPPDSLDEAEPLSEPEPLRVLLPEPLPNPLRKSLRESLL